MEKVSFEFGVEKRTSDACESDDDDDDDDELVRER